MFKKFFILIFILFISDLTNAQSTLNQLDVNGKRHGVWKKLYANGNLRYVGSFEHGKEIGTFKFYAITGEKHPMVIKKFKVSNAIADVQYFSTNAVLESEGKMDGKKRIGVWTYYFVDGKTILSTESYKNGLLDGVTKTYYNSGEVAEIAHFQADKLNGNRTRYSDTGAVTENLTYQNGIIHGPAVIYDQEGAIFAQGSYENGIKTGIWEFNMDGEMVKSSPDKMRKK